MWKLGNDVTQLPVLSQNGTPKTHGNLTFQSKRSLLKKMFNHPVADGHLVEAHLVMVSYMIYM
jgi:hypothetical protein